MTRDEGYLEAERRIEKARQAGATELNLGNLELTEVPEAISSLTQLQSLDLSKNQLRELPEGITSLTQLQSLDLSYNKLKELEAIASLTQLQSLDLGLNQLTELPETITSLIQLQSLKLSSNKLTELPEAIASLTQLQTLNLSSNQLTELPEAIASLTQLQTLNLSSNKLTEVPEAIASLTQLQSLDLSGNQLTELPEAIASLTQLQTLNLISNQLTELPETLGRIRYLQYLYLFHNQLMKLPESLGELTQLEALVLFDNKLTDLPKHFSNLNKLQVLSLSSNPFTSLPEQLGQLTQLQHLGISNTQIDSLPIWLGNLIELKTLCLSGNDLNDLPEILIQLTKLRDLQLGKSESMKMAPKKTSNNQQFISYSHYFDRHNNLTSFPEWMQNFTQLERIDLTDCRIVDLPANIYQLNNLEKITLRGNPLNPDLAAAYEQGIHSIMQYLRAKAEGEVTLNEAKLILVGEGEVGKSCLLGALRGDPWVDGRPTTHGIEIKTVTVTAPDSTTKITLNGWDFGGQRVYRPTHQLFFSAPAVYLVVWKPREGPQQGFVKEWITLIKHREPDAKVLVVATHGGPGQRQPDIDRQELIDLFGSDTVVGFFHVDSKPNAENQYCHGIAELREAISNIAAALPGMGRTVPTKWQHIREILDASGKTHLPYSEVIVICEEQGLEGFAAELFIRVSHTLGYLIHYHYDTTLKDFVILKPDWLAKAISFVLDDQTTRSRNGLVEFTHLSQLWSHPPFEGETGYPKELHPVFLRLMERFDLSYRVVLDPSQPSTTSLIAQLVLDNRPDQLPNWEDQPEIGDRQQVQICRIVDERGQLANAEGLFYQLIVRLHKYSLGRDNYEKSVHWQRGLMLENGYNGRALLEHIGTDVKITVRAAYPERFLSYLTEEIKWLIENPNNPFGWKGLRCNVMVSCIEPCGMNDIGNGLFEVQKLIESKKKNRNEYPCSVSGCDEWQNIDKLLYNAPIGQTPVQEVLSEKLTDVQATLQIIRKELLVKDQRDQIRYQDLSEKQRATMSQVDQQFGDLIQMLIDEAKDGPRLFSFMPVDPKFFDRPKWLSAKFQITLWCEHSRQPLPALNPAGSKQGIYELDLPREWFVKAAPLLKTMSVTLSLILPVAGSATKFMLDDTTYKGIEEQLDLGQKSLESVVKTSDLATTWQSKADKTKLEHGEAIRAEGGMLRSLHALLKQQDPSFGGLIQVQNKRREFLWVHPQFVNEY